MNNKNNNNNNNNNNTSNNSYDKKNIDEKEPNKPSTFSYQQQQQQQKQDQKVNSSGSRVIEIPVQHYQNRSSHNSPSNTSAAYFNPNQARPARNSPLTNTNFSSNYQPNESNQPHFGSFNHSTNLFDDYQSPFNLLNNNNNSNNRSFISSNNLPFSSRFGGADADEFFNQPADRFFNSNLRYSPNKDTHNSRFAQNTTNSSDQQQHQHQHPFQYSNANAQKKESPVKKYTSQTIIQPNQHSNLAFNQQSSTTESKDNNNIQTTGIPIPIKHVSSSPERRNQHSYVQHQQQSPSKTNQTSLGESNMGNLTSSGSSSNKKQAHSTENNTSDFLSPNSQRQSNNHSHSNLTKSDEEKCNDIGIELTKLEIDVNNFSAKKNDKSYLKLEEMLTCCLLKLDAIDRGDERVNQLRRKLINFTHQLSDRLETKATASSNGQPQQQEQQNDNVSSTSSNNDVQQPPLKRSKSPQASESSNSQRQNENGQEQKNQNNEKTSLQGPSSLAEAGNS